jgi:hypothetical protein
VTSLRPLALAMAYITAGMAVAVVIFALAPLLALYVVVDTFLDR